MSEKTEAFEELNGTQTDVVCPKCVKGLLFVNSMGNKWCSSFECDYHTDSKGKIRKYSRDIMADDKIINHGGGGRARRRD